MAFLLLENAFLLKFGTLHNPRDKDGVYFG